MGSAVNQAVHLGSFGILDPGKEERDALNRANAISTDNAAFMAGIESPDLKWEDFNPEMINPELVDYREISEDPEIRQLQLRSLEKLSGLADTGLSAADELGYVRARNEGAQMAKAGTEAALASAAARGVSGGGLEFAMREMANQGGAQRAQEAALETASKAAENRAKFELAYNQGLGNQRAQDFDVNRANTDIINRYNEANTNTKNQALQNNVAARNAAQQYNQAGRTNTQQQRFDNELTRRGAITGATQQVRENHLATAAKAAADNRAMMGAIGTIGGAVVGGPAGAAVGGQIGNSAGGSSRRYDNYA